MLVMGVMVGQQCSFGGDLQEFSESLTISVVILEES